jgi:putative ABC transport system substrate-binding protein
MRRRDLIAGLGAGLLSQPLVASAQRPSMPVVGTLFVGYPEALRDVVAAFREGLSQTGYVEGQSVGLEHRFAGGRSDRLPAIAADLVRRRVAVIFTPSLQAALAAKAATSTIPIVFRIGSDPVQYSLLTSINKPNGNLTGIYDIEADLGAKRLGLLHDLLPGASRFAVLVDPTDAASESAIKDLRAAATVIERAIEFFPASNNREIDIAIAGMAQKRVEALLVPPSFLFFSRRVQLVTLATHYWLPAIYAWREYVEIGGLMSYGSVLADQYRQAGIYAGRILKGEKPADLPVLQPTKFEFLLNLQIARVLGIEVPPTLLAQADEVIE